MWVQSGCWLWLRLPSFWRVHSVQVCRLSGLCHPFVACSLLLSALLLCAWCIGLKYGSTWRFKGVFSVVWGFRVGLCCLGALRGLCGFCARVELGGFGACCVFASIFPLLCFRFCPFVLVSLCLLSFACPLSCLSSFVCSCVLCGFCCCFFFPHGLHAKKERAQILASSLVLLCVFIFLCSY